MKVLFHPAADAELDEAIEYYESQESGLGRVFAEAVRDAVQRALMHPRAWSPLDGELRRSLVARFPYGVIYAESKDGLYILAVMHLHRSPDYWRARGPY